MPPRPFHLPDSVHDEPHHAEELLNSMTHGLGAVLSVIGTVVLVILATSLGDLWKVTGFSIFGLTLLMLYLASTLYHGSRQPRRREIFKTLDHCAIFLLIAGSYTPFLLVNLRDSSGWLLLGIIWSLALVGVLLKLHYGSRYKPARVGIYLLMGWLIMFASGDLLANISSTGFNLLLAGGITYTVGVVFYLANSMPYNHAIWHLFVVGGSACHYFAMFYGVLPV